MTKAFAFSKKLTLHVDTLNPLTTKLVHKKRALSYKVKVAADELNDTSTTNSLEISFLKKSHLITSMNILCLPYPTK